MPRQIALFVNPVKVMLSCWVPVANAKNNYVFLSRGKDKLESIARFLSKNESTKRYIQN